tara:strand:+ start:1624 stop:2001 length:378 start_codon:yes stop_codon:yes gene_type:complete
MFVLEKKIPEDIWLYCIKPCIVHDIKTQGRHLKKSENNEKFNKTMIELPKKRIIERGIKIVYNSAKKPFRLVKFFYYGKVRKNPNKNLIIIEMVPLMSFCQTWWDMRKKHYQKRLSRIVHDFYKL